jgi:hypothetical protein
MNMSGIESMLRIRAMNRLAATGAFFHLPMAWRCVSVDSPMLDLAQLNIYTTPTLVLVRETLEHNLDLMQGMCNAAGVRLRPHGKMHKCSTLANASICSTSGHGLRD